MKRYCFKCGCVLKETTSERYFCPNCGMIDDNNPVEEIEHDKEVSYIR